METQDASNGTEVIATELDALAALELEAAGHSGVQEAPEQAEMTANSAAHAASPTSTAPNVSPGTFDDPWLGKQISPGQAPPTPAEGQASWKAFNPGFAQAPKVPAKKMSPIPKQPAPTQQSPSETLGSEWDKVSTAPDVVDLRELVQQQQAKIDQQSELLNKLLEAQANQNLSAAQKAKPEASELNGDDSSWKWYNQNKNS